MNNSKQNKKGVITEQNKSEIIDAFGQEAYDRWMKSDIATWLEFMMISEVI